MAFTIEESEFDEWYQWLKDNNVNILEGHMMPDHVHLLVSIPTKISVSSFMGYFKGKSALMIFDRHANLEIVTFGQKDIM